MSGLIDAFGNAAGSLLEARRRHLREAFQRANGIQEKRWGQTAYDPKMIAHWHTLPVFDLSAPFNQLADGSFPAMVGFTTIGTPTPPTPLINFVYGPPDGSYLDMSPAAYPIDMTGATVTIPVAHPISSSIMPPEANHIKVWTAPQTPTVGALRFKQEYWNVKSCTFPGFTTHADPNSPHYLPSGERVFEYPDPSFYAGDTAQGYTQTQQIVSFVARQLFNYLCLARRIVHLEAPLACIKDAVTGRYRLPRFYDPCSVDGVSGWLIRECAPGIMSDGLQMAMYECELVEPYLP